MNQTELTMKLIEENKRLTLECFKKDLRIAELEKELKKAAAKPAKKSNGKK